MFEILGVFMVAMSCHELAHAAVLIKGHANLQCALRHPRWRLLLSLGLGWAYDPLTVAPKVRLRSWGVAPLVEACVWGLGAVVLPGAAVVLLIMAAFELVGNWYLPHSDGWQYRKLRAASTS